MFSCHSCNESFAGYEELALHIMSQKKGHRKGKKWATKYLMVNSLSAKAKRGDRPERVPLTEEEKESKVNCHRELSGVEKLVVTICPRCRRTEQQPIPIEYAQSPTAWRMGKSLVVICEGCR